jgi:hypothetical protein
LNTLPSIAHLGLRVNAGFEFNFEHNLANRVKDNKLMKKVFATFYTTYMKSVARFNKTHNEHKSKDAEEKRLLKEFGSKPFEELDKEAILLGNAYRGIGVVIALLSALIIFSAIAPVAFDWHGVLYWVFGLTEVLSMVLVIGLIVYAKKSCLHLKWKRARLLAEQKRYKRFSELLKTAEESPTSRSVENLSHETLSHLSGKGCQVSYNARKAKEYHGIETFCGIFGWVAFGLALGGALFHLWFHANWLLIFTVFLPALVGALHALNSFLKLDDLADDHRQMSNKLSFLKDQIDQIGDDSDCSEAKINLSKTVYKTLLFRDKQWLAMVDRQSLKA